MNKYKLDEKFKATLIIIALVINVLMITLSDFFVISINPIQNDFTPYGLYRLLNVFLPGIFCLITIVYFSLDNKTTMREVTLIASGTRFNKYLIKRSISWIKLVIAIFFEEYLLGIIIYYNKISEFKSNESFIIIGLNVIVPMIFLLLLTIGVTLIIRDIQTVVLGLIGYFLIFEYYALVVVFNSPLLLYHFTSKSIVDNILIKLIYIIVGCGVLAFAFYKSRRVK